MSLHDELMAVQAKRGELSRQAVVDEARPKSSPLHSYFEWDDRVGGEKYRLVQAGRLIRSVRTVYREGNDEEGPRTLRAFHSIQREDQPKPVYEHIEDIAVDPVAMSLLLRSAARDWQVLRRRYGALTEFWEMVQADMAEAV